MLIDNNRLSLPTSVGRGSQGAWQRLERGELGLFEFYEAFSLDLSDALVGNELYFYGSFNVAGLIMTGRHSFQVRTLLRTEKLRYASKCQWFGVQLMGNQSVHYCRGLYLSMAER